MFLLNSTADPSILTVVLMGIGIVFVGLIVIIFMCKVLGWIVGSTTKAEETKAPVEAKVNNAPAVTTTIENRGEVVAAISAAVAENLGKDVSAIRILSIKKV